MFDLDYALREWRRQMIAAGIPSPVPLDELESHLRDDVEQQIESGLEAEHAFDAAALRIGPAIRLKNEFAIAYSYEPMKQFLINILTIISVLAIGAALILPEVAKWRAHEPLAVTGMTVFLIGAAILAYGAVCGVLLACKRPRT